MDVLCGLVGVDGVGVSTSDSIGVVVSTTTSGVVVSKSGIMTMVS